MTPEEKVQHLEEKVKLLEELVETQKKLIAAHTVHPINLIGGQLVNPLQPIQVQCPSVFVPMQECNHEWSNGTACIYCLKCGTPQSPPVNFFTVTTNGPVGVGKAEISGVTYGNNAAAQTFTGTLQ